jgi:hypothetical protein
MCVMDIGWCTRWLGGVQYSGATTHGHQLPLPVHRGSVSVPHCCQCTEGPSVCLIAASAQRVRQCASLLGYPHHQTAVGLYNPPV